MELVSSETRSTPVPIADAERRGFRLPEIARELGLSRTVVYEAFYRGEFEAVWRFGRAIVIPADEVKRWLESKAA